LGDSWPEEDRFTSSVAASNYTSVPGEYSVVGGNDLTLNGGALFGNTYDYVAGGPTNYSIQNGSLTL
jgi:hypothetical protein